MTEQQWIATALAVAGGLIVIATAMKVAVIPFFRALFQALLSAPQIRDDLSDLKAIVRSDILEKFAAEQVMVGKLEQRVTNLEDEMRLQRLALAELSKHLPS